MSLNLKKQVNGLRSKPLQSTIKQYRYNTGSLNTAYSMFSDTGVHYPWSPCALPINHGQNNVFHVFGCLFYYWRLLFQASLFIRPKSVDYSGAAVQMVKADSVEKSSRLFAASSSSLFFLSASYRVPKATCKIEWHVDASAFNSCFWVDVCIGENLQSSFREGIVQGHIWSAFLFRQ